MYLRTFKYQPYKMTLLTILKTIQKPAILVLAFVYLLVPLQKPLLEGFHKLEHAILQTDVDYSHELAHDADIEHGHEHKAISFLSELFSSEKNASDSEMHSKELKFDKHFQEPNFTSETLPKPFKKSLFFFVSETYSVVPRNDTPPPRFFFS